GAGEGREIKQREAPRNCSGTAVAAAAVVRRRPGEGAAGSDATPAASNNGREGADRLGGGGVGCGCDGVDTDDDDDDIAAQATAALDGSCLRSVCRQYLFGADWRFVSTHHQFYLALLRLLQEVLRPFNDAGAVGDGGGYRRQAAGGAGEPRSRQPLARSLLRPSADCPGMVDLLVSLCVALDDLVACPPQPPPPAVSPAPTRLPQPSASPAAAKHLPPPSPASPLKLSFLTQQEQEQHQQFLLLQQQQHASSPPPPPPPPPQSSSQLSHLYTYAMAAAQKQHTGLPSTPPPPLPPLSQSWYQMPPGWIQHGKSQETAATQSVLDAHAFSAAAAAVAAGAPSLGPASYLVQAKYHPKYKKYFKMMSVGLPRSAALLRMSKDGVDQAILDAPDAMLPLSGAGPAAMMGVPGAGPSASALSAAAAVSQAGPPKEAAANTPPPPPPPQETSPVLGDQQQGVLPPPHGTPGMPLGGQDGASVASSPAAEALPPPPPPLPSATPPPPTAAAPPPSLPLTAPHPPPGPIYASEAGAWAWYSAATSSSSTPGPGWSPPPPAFAPHALMPPPAHYHGGGVPDLPPEKGKTGGTAAAAPLPPPPLPPPPPSLPPAAGAAAAAMYGMAPPPPPPTSFMGGAQPPMGLRGGRRRELPPPKSYEEEKREHDQGVAMADLARSVLVLAKSAVSTAGDDAATAGAATVERGEKAASAPAAAGPAAAAGPGSAGETAPAAGAGASAAGAAGAAGAGTATTEDGDGSSATRAEADPGGRAAEGLPASAEVVVRTESVEAVPSEKALYLKAIEQEQFATMQMEVAAPPPPPVKVGEKADDASGLAALAAATAKPEQQHHFWKVAEAEGSAFPARQRRLVRELRSLARELPLYWGSTIAVRMDEERPHLLKAMIAAPTGTPYDSGLFEFDIYCPPQYPSVPPKVNLMTTGRGRVRFSPNLYACGNVCLSLLGTWSGSPEMMWSPDASLLQVLLSIQTFILGTQYPYYNEPGLELDYGHPGSMDRARTSPNGGYEVLRPQTVEWAMTEALRFPPRGFEALAREHLWRKKWHILDVVAGWLRESKKPAGVRGHYRDLVTSLKNLLTELIRLSYSMGDCPYVPPRPVPASIEPAAAAVTSAAAFDGDEPSRAEYFAAVRGIFGPEAGPLSDNDNLRERRRRRRKKLKLKEKAAAAAADVAVAAAAGNIVDRGDREQASGTGTNSGGGNSGSGHGEPKPSSGCASVHDKSPQAGE
ncbi:unnamed protein product, partial [Ectocarpus sp. 12 AP-2014]